MLRWRNEIERLAERHRRYARLRPLARADSNDMGYFGRPARDVIWGLTLNK